MTACERCWNDAFIETRRTGEGQAEAYRRLIAERDSDFDEVAKCFAYKDSRDHEVSQDG